MGHTCRYTCRSSSLFRLHKVPRCRRRVGARARRRPSWQIRRASPRTRLACWTKKIAPIASSTIRYISAVPVSLAERLKDLIRREGAISFHDWMKAALYDPDGGYYQRADCTRWGREGDYRTSPERSELFAATFAHYFAGLAEGDLTIVECGAGNGSFAAGVLSTLREQHPRYIVYDVSQDALNRSRERLAEFDGVEFYSDWDQVSVKRGIYFANELLDAFPVHRVLNTNDGLSEFYVTVDSSGDFVWTTGPLATPR